MLKNLRIWTIGSLFEQASKALVYLVVLNFYSVEDTYFYSLYLLFTSLNILTQFGILDRLYLHLPKLQRKPRAYDLYFQKYFSMLSTLQWTLQFPLICIFAYMYDLNAAKALIILITCNATQYLNLLITKIRYQNEMKKAVGIRIQVALAKIIVITLALAHMPITQILMSEFLILVFFIIKFGTYSFLSIEVLTINSIKKFLKRNKLLISLMLCLVLSSTAERNLVAYFFSEKYLILLTTVAVFISPVLFVLNQFLSILAQEYRKNITSVLNVKIYFGHNIVRGQLLSIIVLSFLLVFITFEHYTNSKVIWHDEMFIASFILILKVTEGLVIAKYYNQKIFGRVIMYHILCLLSIVSWYSIVSPVHGSDVINIILISSALRMVCITFIDVSLTRILLLLCIFLTIYYLALNNLSGMTIEIFLVILQTAVLIVDLKRKIIYETR